MTTKSADLEELAQEDRTWLKSVSVAETLPAVPQDTELLQVLGDLAVPGPELDEAIRLRARIDDHELRYVLERVLTILVGGIGSSTGPDRLPDLSGCDDPLARYLYLYAFAACFPLTRQWHRDREIPDEVGRRTLADLGRQMTHQRRRHGRSGLMINTAWLTHHFQGRLFQLGRLQFELAGLGRTTSTEIRAAGTDVAPGAPTLLVHIPGYCGPMDPASVRESIEAARRFFGRHFPEHQPATLTCHSWLLDPQLAGYLPADSNIISFQRLFTINQRPTRPTASDADTFEFVFGRRDVEARDELPRDTTLQRALIDHVDGGGHWYGGVGWRPFQATEAREL
ncbi:hypothetical protein GCM10011575_26090 [Microlunatus endophyticus]|uniref:Acyltransferase n=1 Tax=Microlunatus endophyticus TaxID=1716077 RepID=A0A917SBF0_9ACTN|nr:acyltransferase domain-containing protein [Microlunatus endophyticus]GGL66363.1 hypothetical protein GCM10011575_26090 [Microlunatus endophyticus]